MPPIRSFGGQRDRLRRPRTMILTDVALADERVGRSSYQRQPRLRHALVVVRHRPTSRSRMIVIHVRTRTNSARHIDELPMTKQLYVRVERFEAVVHLSTYRYGGAEDFW